MKTSQYRRYSKNTKAGVKPSELSLPKGARNIPPKKKKLSNWVEMTFDAELIHRGIRWLRVKGGFGERGDREDWVADIKDIGISVSDYNFCKAKYWGIKEHQSDTIFGAMDIQILEALEHTKYKKEKLQKKLKELSSSIDKVELAASDIIRNKGDLNANQSSKA